MALVAQAAEDTSASQTWCLANETCQSLIRNEEIIVSHVLRTHFVRACVHRGAQCSYHMLSRGTSSWKSSKKGLRISLVVSQRLPTCLSSCVRDLYHVTLTSDQLKMIIFQRGTPEYHNLDTKTTKVTRIQLYQFYLWSSWIYAN